MSSSDHHTYNRTSEEARPILAERYKTKMCKSFVASGECRYGIRCMFAHGEHELRTPEQNVQDGLVTEEAIKGMQHQLLAQQRGHAAYHGYGNPNGYRRPTASSMLPPPPPFPEDLPMVHVPAPRVMHNPYLLDLLPRESHLYTYPAGYSDAMSVSSRSSYDYFPEAGSQCSGRISPVLQPFQTQCQKAMSWGDLEDSVRDYDDEGRVMEP